MVLMRHCKFLEVGYRVQYGLNESDMNLKGASSLFIFGCVMVATCVDARLLLLTTSFFA